MDITVTIEFTAETRQHLKQLAQQLHHIRDVRIDLVEAKDHAAPTLLGIGILKTGPRGAEATHHVAQTLYNFLHDAAHAGIQQQVELVTIEGDRTDITNLPTDQIERIIAEAQAGA
jgi:chemotaxis protein histidine kinase CheA